MPSHDRLSGPPLDADDERCEEDATRAGGAGLDAVVCNNVEVLCREIVLGAGRALLIEEAAATGGLREALHDQPAWSDFSLMVLGRDGAKGRGLAEAVNATLVKRPVKIRSLLSVVRAARWARWRQYADRDHLEPFARSGSAFG